jgi:hypothetical protein
LGIDDLVSWVHKSTYNPMKIRSLVNSWNHFLKQHITFTNVLLTNIKAFQVVWMFINFDWLLIKKKLTTKLSSFFFVNSWTSMVTIFFTSHGFFADKTEFLSIGLGTPWSIGWRWHHSCTFTIAFSVIRIDYFYLFRSGLNWIIIWLVILVKSLS